MGQVHKDVNGTEQDHGFIGLFPLWLGKNPKKIRME